MSVRLSRDHELEIRRHGEESYPHECCGFLLGSGETSARRIEVLRPAVNQRDESNRHNRYLITPQSFRDAENAAREQELELIGFYHSHPDADARPSQFDADHAWPWYIYIIISVRDGDAGRMTAWTLRDDRAKFDEKPLLVDGAKEPHNAD
jgi:proteasome lid subunit RPN8/RPN11